MAKKDGSPVEDTDRQAPTENNAAEKPAQPETPPDDGLTHVKNAHATGLGSMGRNDEDQLGSAETK
jgi:hypothetical protein